MGRRRKREEESCIDLLERAVHLLRSVSLSDLLPFYVGAVPFIVALLFFLSDMAASPFAAHHCAGTSLGLAVLYLWMRTWHSVFCQRLHAHVEHRPAARWRFRGGCRTALFHAAYSCWSVVLIPVSMVIVFPVGWVTAYLNNLCVVESASTPFKQAAARARSASRSWPLQNNYALAILSLFGFMVLINIIIASIQIPALLKSLLGVETLYTQHQYWMMNSTFLGSVLAITYLLVDPLSKAIYVLRYSAIDSLTTGEDILAELKRLPPKRRVADLALAGAVMILICMPRPLAAQEMPPAEAPAIPVQELNQSIDRILQDREFTWRMPRDYAEVPDEDLGFFARFADSVATWMEKSIEAVYGAIERFFDWLGDLMPDSDKRSDRRHSGGIDPGLFKVLSVILLVSLLLVMLVFVIKNVKRRNAVVWDVREAEPVRVSVDLDDEDLVATMLEEDEWIRLAREMASAGELRKAVRAWFLAGVACLSRAELLAVRPSKSNLEYRRELGRRARRQPHVVPVFVDNIQVFEQAWYGLHAVLPADIDRMEHNLERMRNEGDA